MSKQLYYVPVTPGGTMVFDCKASTKQKAILNLMKAASHMPYKNWHEFAARGYTIEECKL
jgi:hypothetical protein